MDKLGEYAKDDCKMTEKVYDSVWGSDPHFPHWNGFSEEQWMQPPVVDRPNRPTKPAPIPYSGGNKPEPKLEWKVDFLQNQINPSFFGSCWIDRIRVSLLEDGEQIAAAWADEYAGLFTSKSSSIKKAKKQLLHDYNLCKKESGRVENS